MTDFAVGGLNAVRSLIRSAVGLMFGGLAIGMFSAASSVAQPPIPEPPALRTPQVSRPVAENPLGLPTKAVASGGALVVCGGGQMGDEVYDEFVRLAGGKNARIVVIPSAYAFSSMTAVRNRYAGWYEYDVRSLDFLDAQSRGQADTAAFAGALANATGVWFGGGMQSRLAALYAGTRAEVALHSVIERGGVIGGTSAGAAAMSQTMIHSGVGENVNLDRGLGFMSQTIVDQHFTQRNRHTRLLSALGEHPEQIGLGVDEGTAVVVQGNRLRVLGAHRATLVVPSGAGTTLHSLKKADRVELVAVADHRAGEATVVLRRVEQQGQGQNRNARAAAVNGAESTIARNSAPPLGEK